MLLLLILSLTCGYSVWKFGKGTSTKYQGLVSVCYTAMLLSIVYLGTHSFHPELLATSTLLNILALLAFKH